jgi:nucleoside-diphosphate-sugar epimerase
MQTILGANGIIATELAKELYKSFTKDIRLVSRNPKKVNNTDQLFSADLLNKDECDEAIKGSEIVYMTVGLPYNSTIWKEKWPILMHNIIDACKHYNAKLVFFDNVYMYGEVMTVMTEETPFNPISIKGNVREEIATMVLNEIKNKSITAMICRAPEFYGPSNTQSGTNATIFENIKKKKKLQVLVKDSTIRTLIYTPDAGKATALLGNTPDAYDQTWHLPCDTNRKTAKEFIEICSHIYGSKLDYMILNKWMIKIFGLFNSNVKEIVELLYQFDRDYIFDCSKFKKRFPDFKITSIEKGITKVISELK